jgi:hypothetical protein
MAEDKKGGMGLKEYFFLKKTIETHGWDSEEARAFGRAHPELCRDGSLVLIEWAKSRFHISSAAENISKIAAFLTILKSLSFILAFFAGVATAGLLLKYDGSEPVNIVYILIFALWLPLLGIAISLLSMSNIGGRSGRLFISLFPLLYISEILEKLFSIDIESDRRLFASYILLLAQLFGIIFLLGLLLAFLVNISARDIAFGWSSTLNLSAREIYEITTLLSLPWREFLPSATPSIDLIESSHFYHYLGASGKASVNDGAAILGEWWRFLAATLFFYGIVPRSIFAAIVYLFHRKVLEESILSIPQAEKLLQEICQPRIESRSPVGEKPMRYADKLERVSTAKASTHYEHVAGWAMQSEEIGHYLEARGIVADEIFELGGRHSPKENSRRVAKLSGRLLMLVKSWEPPTMDIVDMLEELSEKRALKTALMPVGMRENSFQVDPGDMKIWIEKLSHCGLKSVEIIE